MDQGPRKFDRAELMDRDRLEMLIRESDYGAVLVTSLENLAYACGYYNPGFRQMPNRMHVAIWPREGTPVFLVPQYNMGLKSFIQERRGYDFYARDTPVNDPRGCVHVVRSAMPALAEILEEMGLAGGRIGLEMGHFPASRYQELRKLLPDAELVDCDSLFYEARMIKTAAEIELLRSASIATLKAIQVAYELARPGDSIRSVADSMTSAMVRLGADKIAFLELDVIRGKESFDYLSEPVALKQGDVLRVDMGGYFDGYYSDLARVAMVSKPDPEQLAMYHKLLGVQRTIINDLIKPGLTGGELFRSIKGTFQGAGLKTPWGMIIHGIGLYIHERPWARELETYRLEPNMALMVEVYHHGYDGKIRQQIEDLVLVTESGARVLSTYGSTDEPYLIT